MCIVDAVIPLHTQAHTHTVEAVYRAQFTMIEIKEGKGLKIVYFVR